MPRFSMSCFLALLGCVLATGCKARLPKVVEAEGQIVLGGKPLPKAYIQFIPDLKDFGAEANSFAVSDDQGRFKLTCMHNQQPGAVIGTHRVTVVNALPEADGNSAEPQGRGPSPAVVERFLRSLPNRPIPARYGKFTTTTLRVEIEAGKTEYKLELTRP